MLSKELRKRYGLASEGPTGLSPEEEQELVSRDSRAFTNGNGKGWDAEFRFLLAWRDSKYWPQGLVAVRKATEHEDANEKTDAVMHIANGNVIRFQIKSSRGQGGESVFLAHLILPIPVVLVVVEPSDSFSQIRENTLRAILSADKEISRIKKTRGQNAS